MGVLTRDASFTRSNETAHPCCAEGSRNPMDGGYPSHIHHVSHVRNMRENFFAIPGLVLVRDAVWHVVVCSQYRHDRGGL